MRIKDIKEAGCNNILKWAISNEADILGDSALISLINDELFFLVTLENINFFELFRLTQMYREKLRIINSSTVEIPPRTELASIFNGQTLSNPDDENSPVITYAELAENAITSFINLATQMKVDEDIIHNNAIKLFIPMICTQYEVQIPVAFADMLQFLTPKEADDLFTKTYPETLENIIEDNSHSFQRMVGIAFSKSTEILKYDKQYDVMVKTLKYSFLKKYEKDTLYKFHLIGFSKKDNILRSEIRVNLFKPDPKQMQDAMKKMARLKTPLEVEFAVQIPLLYLQELENQYSREIFPILYESSMSQIIENSIVYNDFQLLEYQDEELTEEQAKQLEERENAISAYKIRITEANEILWKTIHLLLDKSENVHPTSVFALLPSIYSSNFVINIDEKSIDLFLKDVNNPLHPMFEQMKEIIKNLSTEIKKSK